jgi:hypothetical protein
VTTASLKTNHRKNECLGIAMGNHTVFHQGTTGCLFLSFSQVSAQEYLPFLESQTRRSSPPSFGLLFVHFPLQYSLGSFTFLVLVVRNQNNQVHDYLPRKIIIIKKKKIDIILFL